MRVSILFFLFSHLARITTASKHPTSPIVALNSQTTKKVEGFDTTTLPDDYDHKLPLSAWQKKINFKHDELGEELIEGAKNGDTKIIRQCLTKNKDIINYRGSDEGKSALMQSCIKGSSAAAQLLIKEGANIDLQDPFGNTALSHASKNGKLPCVKVLLRAKANTELKNDKHEDPLYQATKIYDQAKIDGNKKSGKIYQEIIKWLKSPAQEIAWEEEKIKKLHFALKTVAGLVSGKLILELVKQPLVLEKLVPIVEKIKLPFTKKSPQNTVKENNNAGEQYTQDQQDSNYLFKGSKSISLPYKDGDIDVSMLAITSNDDNQIVY